MREPRAIHAPEHEQQRAQQPHREPDRSDRRCELAILNVLTPLLEQVVQRLAVLVSRGGIDIRAVRELGEKPPERPDDLGTATHRDGDDTEIQ